MQVQQFSRAAALSLASITACASAPEGAARSTADSSAEERVDRFTSGGEGFMTNSYYVEGRDAVVVFDTQFLPSIAEKLLAEVKAVSAGKRLVVVNLHASPDKFNGNGLFKDAGARLVTNAATRAAMPAVDASKRAFWSTVDFYKPLYPASVPFPEGADVFTGQATIELGGGREVELHELKNEGIAERQTVGVVRDVDGSAKVFVGDLVHTKTHAWQENGTPTAWIMALDEVRALTAKGTVYPGRGEPSAFDGESGALVEQQHYLAAYRGLMADSANLASNRDARVKHVAEGLKAAFPDYGMADLIGYSLPADAK